jgi:hypothetical protein
MVQNETEASDDPVWRKRRLVAKEVVVPVDHSHRHRSNLSPFRSDSQGTHL